jgi:hypothetical protein
MTATTGRLAKVDDYLRRMEEELRTKGVNAAQRREILAELKSHLVDRIAEFQAEGSPDPVGQALAALGDPLEIASELAATANLRAASHSFFPTSLLSAAWSMARKFGRGLRLFLFGFVGYILSLGALITVVMKMVLPDRVGFWVGDFGFVWGIPPNTAAGRELAGNWFIPITAWLAILFAVGTTLLLRHQVRSFLRSHNLRYR